MKGYIGNKAITTIKNDQNKNVAVFEGMMGFLSFLTHQNITDFQSSAIIMNSVAMKSETLKAIQSDEFEKVYLFLDNDNAGDDAKTFFTDGLDLEMVDKSGIHSDFKDYNDFWISRANKIEK